MKVEIISIGNELLMSDILDTNSSYISRSLREVRVSLTCRVTVGDDPDMISDVLQVALQRADVVLTTGGLGRGANDFTRQAVARVTGRTLLDNPPGIEGAILLGEDDPHPSGLMLKEPQGTLICLPGSRQDMAYLLETIVLPYIKEQLVSEVPVKSGWVLLRTVGVMESSLKQQLSDLGLMPTQRITFDSFAGQCNIRLWAEAESEEQVQHELAILRQEVLARLGDHIFGEGEERLEDVVLQTLLEKNIRLSIAECFTEQIFTRTLVRLPHASKVVTAVPAQTWQEVNDYLSMSDFTPENDLTNWCRSVAERLLPATKTDISLVVYSNMTQGGVQLIVTLASALGVSVTQRSFGGHPENINQWACTLGLTHLRRWLMAHS